MNSYSNILIVTCLVFGLAGCTSSDKKTTDSKDNSEPTEQAAVQTPTPEPVSLNTLTEVEPNDTSAKAMELDASCLVNASMEAAKKPKLQAIDWYKIVTPGKKLVSIQLTGIAEDDLQLEFLDAGRNKLFVVDSGTRGEGEKYPNLLLEEACYLKVKGSKGGSGGAYQLTIKMNDPLPGEESEYNGRYSRANDFVMGSSIKGYLSHARDEDWYQVKLGEMPTGSVVRIDLTGVDGVRYLLSVLDMEERRPVLEIKSVQGEGLIVRNLGVPANSKGLYLAVKSAWVPKAGRKKKFVRTFNSDSSYTLSISAEAGGDDLERQPNDDSQHALPIADGQKIKAYLSDPNDVDWYKINVDRPSLLAAKLSALNRVDLQLYVVNPEKKTERRNFYWVRINDGKVNETETLTNCALASGENYIRVEGAFKKLDGKWIRDFFNLDETYELTVNLRTDDGREEREPNGSIDKAMLLTVGTPLRGTLHPKGDVDVYKLDLSNQDGPVTTTIECSGIPKVNISLKLLGPEMNDQGKHEAVASSNRGKAEEGEQIVKELMPGEYWVVVSGPRFGVSNTKDNYLLSVSQ
jgi:hypothetical protein